MSRSKKRFQKETNSGRIHDPTDSVGMEKLGIEPRAFRMTGDNAKRTLYS